ncbi:sigma-E processing peptidase SpoIIGA [Bacillus sp. FJAT-45350]|uniref:sigma-E processing peptidase SpoIIGA n=1 Tax=Bacillus sp. FJAT-45350 TaxID=2011014 RepID=UPI000BB6EBC0|nr:sigma-E processing peptidase SpoIIGA [Bacillus sp. FJAT-45350]
MTVYLDVIWFLNLCIDMMLIMMTAVALKRPFKKWRFFAAALLASTVVLILFTPMAWLFYKPWMKLLFSMVIVLLAFGFKRFSYFIQNLLMFYFVTFMTGGGLFALHFFWQTEVEILDGIMMTKTSGFGSTFSWIFVLIGFPLIWYFSKQQIGQIEAKKVRYDEITSVEIGIDGTIIHVQGLVDSGNQLHDPITKVPVMILELKALEDHLPKEVIANLKDVESLTMNENEASQRYADRIRIIPYRAVGHGQQFLLALKPDYVKVTNHQEEHLIKRVLVGLNDTILSNEGEYQSIVHPKMLVSAESKKLA